MQLDRASLIARAHTVAADATERAYVTQFIDLMALPGDVTTATHFRPGHVTASGFVASPDRNSVALIHHRKLDRWLQPGGHLESDDADLESAARREIAEEIGIDDLTSLGLFDIDIHTFPQRGDIPEHFHFDVRYAFIAGTSRLQVLDGVIDARWVAFDDLDAYGAEVSVKRPCAKLVALLER